MPNISSKELSAIEDQLSEERLLIKKYESEAAAMSDPTLKQKYSRYAQMHREHYNRLFSYLQ